MGLAFLPQGRCCMMDGEGYFPIGQCEDASFERPPINNSLFHTSSPSRFIGTGPHSEPKSSKTLSTLSRRRVVLPCSSSRTKRSPTPAFSERSTCVSLYFLHLFFTYCAMIALTTIIYSNYLKYHTLNMYPKYHFRVHVPRICTRFASLGYIFKANHYARHSPTKSLYTLSMANIRNENLLCPFSGIFIWHNYLPIVSNDQ